MLLIVLIGARNARDVDRDYKKAKEYGEQTHGTEGQAAAILL